MLCFNNCQAPIITTGVSSTHQVIRSMKICQARSPSQDDMPSDRPRVASRSAICSESRSNASGTRAQTRFPQSDRAVSQRPNYSKPPPRPPRTHHRRVSLIHCRPPRISRNTSKPARQRATSVFFAQKSMVTSSITSHRPSRSAKSQPKAFPCCSTA